MTPSFCLTRSIAGEIIAAMTATPVQYVTTSDGYDIAYAVAGSGRPFVFVPGQFSSLGEDWTEVGNQGPWLRGLAERYRLVYYDGRGQGMSSRGLREEQSIASLGRDLEAIVQHLELSGFILLARWFACHLAIRYAVEHPKLVAGLVLITCSADNTAWPTGIYQSLADENWEAFILSQIPRGGETFDRTREHMERIRGRTSREDLAKRYRAYISSSVEDQLPLLDTPTLVLHPRDYFYLPAEKSMAVAARIANARFALTDGEMVPGDHVTGLEAVDRFVKTLPNAPAASESLRKGLRPASVLSAREVQVLRLIAGGLSNQQVADELVLSIRTVERHITHIYGKIGVRSKAQATAYAHRVQLV